MSVTWLHVSDFHTLAQWLQAHPTVRVISRDRAGAYAKGAREGAPHAVQVADRFHLFCNLTQTLQRVLERLAIRNGSRIRTGTRMRRALRLSAARSRTRSGSRNQCETCERDSRGRIVRSAVAGKEFRTLNPCSSTGRTKGACAGYVVDHIQALKHGGLDEAGNMQWQHPEDAKARDRTE